MLSSAHPTVVGHATVIRQLNQRLPVEEIVDAVLADAIPARIAGAAT
jgi:hypothetical protein